MPDTPAREIPPDDHTLPPDAVGLFRVIERAFPAPGTDQILTALTSEEGRIILAGELGKRAVVDFLKARYKIL